MARNPRPYTFSLYRNDGKLLVNCYGDWSAAPIGGEVLNGEAATRSAAHAAIDALLKRYPVGATWMLWRYGKAVRASSPKMRGAA